MLICLGGVPCLMSGGYPIPCPGGGGVPCPRSRGVPCPRSGGGVTLSQVQGGYPMPGQGYPIQTWLGGVPQVPPSGPDLGWCTPPGQTWDGVPSPWTWLGYPPPPRCELTNKLKTVPSPILRMRAVTKRRKDSIVWWQFWSGASGEDVHAVLWVQLYQNVYK